MYVRKGLEILPNSMCQERPSDTSGNLPEKGNYLDDPMNFVSINHSDDLYRKGM